MLKLKLQYFGHLIRRADSLEKTVMLGKIEGKRPSLLTYLNVFPSSFLILNCGVGEDF